MRVSSKEGPHEWSAFDKLRMMQQLGLIPETK